MKAVLLAMLLVQAPGSELAQRLLEYFTLRVP